MKTLDLIFVSGAILPLLHLGSQLRDCCDGAPDVADQEKSTVCSFPSSSPSFACNIS